MHLLTAGKQPLALLPPARIIRVRIPKGKEPLGWSVDSLFTALVRSDHHSPDLLFASTILHKAGFGIMIHKQPRPGIVHCWNKKFGDKPLSPPETLDIGLLYTEGAKFI